METLYKNLKGSYKEDHKWWVQPSVPAAWEMSAARSFAIDCAARISHLMEDKRSRKALRVARAFMNGEATEVELREATRAADDAVTAAIHDPRGVAGRFDAYIFSFEAARAAAAAARAVNTKATSGVRTFCHHFSAARAAAQAAYVARGWTSRVERKWQLRRLLRYLRGLPCTPVPIK